MEMNEGADCDMVLSTLLMRPRKNGNKTIYSKLSSCARLHRETYHVPDSFAERYDT